MPYCLPCPAIIVITILLSLCLLPLPIIVAAHFHPISSCLWWHLGVWGCWFMPIFLSLLLHLLPLPVIVAAHFHPTSSCLQWQLACVVVVVPHLCFVVVICSRTPIYPASSCKQWQWVIPVILLLSHLACAGFHTISAGAPTVAYPPR